MKNLLKISFLLIVLTIFSCTDTKKPNHSPLSDLDTATITIDDWITNHQNIVNQYIMKDTIITYPHNNPIGADFIQIDTLNHQEDSLLSLNIEKLLYDECVLNTRVFFRNTSNIWIKIMQDIDSCHDIFERVPRFEFIDMNFDKQSDIVASSGYMSASRIICMYDVYYKQNQCFIAQPFQFNSRCHFELDTLNHILITEEDGGI